jgi:hypothetical protein
LLAEFRLPSLSDRPATELLRLVSIELQTTFLLQHSRAGNVEGMQFVEQRKTTAQFAARNL